jgi:hypothetical protein
MTTTSSHAHDAVLAGLWRSARAGRLPHALLLHGPAGIGKFDAALRLVQGLLCARGGLDGPCEVCGPCKRVASGQHLDLFVIDVAHEDVPEDKREERIRIERLVHRPDSRWDGPVVEDFLALRSSEGGWRALIVRDAERLAHSQNEAQNALLKVLEEPGESVLWVLVTSRPQSLLPTLRSRCVQVRLDPLDEGAVERALAGTAGTPERARSLARWSAGSPGRALELAARAGFELRGLLAEVWQGSLSPLAAAARAWELEGDFRGRTPSARQRDRARALIELALELVSDAVRAQAGAPPAQLAHGDLLEEPGALDAVRLRESLDALLQARADLELNLDAAAVVDAGLLAVAAAGPGALP